MRDTLVISGTGFVGRSVVAALEGRGQSVVTTGRGTGLPCDVVDPQGVDAVIAMVRPQGVVVCAGAPHDGPARELYGVHATGTLNVLESVARHSPEAVVVLLGSAAEYGRVDPRILPIRENTPCEPIGFYGSSKLAQTQLGHAAAIAWGIKVRTARLFNVVGPRMPRRYFFPALAARILATPASGTFSLRDATATRDFIHVDDVADAVATLLDQAVPDGIYNVATGIETSILEAATALGAMMGGARPIAAVSSGMALRSVGCAAKLQCLGWNPGRTWKQALADVQAESVRAAA